MLIPHIEGDALLIKHSREDKVNGHLNMAPKIVMLAGNGAIEGGTAPLVQAIFNSTGRKVTEQTAASVSAVLAQKFKAKKYFALKDISEILANMESLDSYLIDYYLFKAEIAKSFHQAKLGGNIHLRESLAVQEIIAEVEISELGVITTNWDTCIWESDIFSNVIHIRVLINCI